MQKSTNYNMNLPDGTDSYNVEHENENTQIIDAEMKRLSDCKAEGSTVSGHILNQTNPHSVTKAQVGLGNVENVSTNDQTPTYSAASSNTALSSGEKLSIAIGKIAKAVSSLISHLANTSNPHSVTKAQVGLGNVDNTSDVNKPTSTAQKTAINQAYANANGYTDTKINNLVNGAPGTLDTIAEVAQAIQENESVVEALNAAIGTKASAAELDTHTENSTIHVTSSERGAWNNKVDKVAGKGLSTNDYTTTEKNKLAGIESEANKTIVTDSLMSTNTMNALSANQGKVLNEKIANKTCTNLFKLTFFGSPSDVHGLNYHVNSDKTFTVSAGTITTPYTAMYIGHFIGDGKTDKIIGIPQTAPNTIYFTILNCTTHETILETTDGLEFVSEKGVLYFVYMTIPQGTTITSTLLIQTMITPNLDAAYDDFVPYTGDTGRLNWEVAKINNNLTELLIVEHFTASAGTVGANTFGNYYIPVAKEGYTALAVTGVIAQANCPLAACNLQDTTQIQVYICVRNVTASPVSFAPAVDVLFMKNLS